jgi:hypothetical protein
MKRIFLLLISIFLVTGCGTVRYANMDDPTKTELPPAPTVKEGTASELSTGTSTAKRVWSPKVLADEFSGATVEVEDDAYGAGWDSDTTHAPSQNAVYDKIESLGGDMAKSTYDTDDDGSVDGQDADEVSSTATGSIEATDVDSAIAELESEKQATITEGSLDNLIDSGDIKDGEIANADIASDAAIAQSKIAGFGGAAAPNVTLNDSDAAGADDADEEAATFQANMGTTTEDSEDSDWWITAMQGGSQIETIRYDESDDQVEVKKDLNLEEDLEIATGKNVTVGSERWDNGSDKLEGAAIEDNGVPQGALSNYAKSEFIPIGWFNDGASAPSGDVTDEDNISYLDFPDDSTTDMECVWLVPSNLTGSTIKVRAIAVITNATAPADTEGVSWGISACSVATDEDHDCTLGTEVYSEDTDLDDSAGTQWDLAFFPYVEVTPTGLAAGELLKLAINRDHDNTDDTYGQDIGLIGVEIKWQEDPGTLTY